MEWSGTVRNDVLKITVASFSYQNPVKILAEGKSLGQETTEVQHLPADGMCEILLYATEARGRDRQRWHLERVQTRVL